MVFGQKIIITFFLQIISLHKLHFHVCYEEVYSHKKFQKFSIKTLVTIVGSKCRKYHKTGLRALGINVKPPFPEAIFKPRTVFQIWIIFK